MQKEIKFAIRKMRNGKLLTRQYYKLGLKIILVKIYNVAEVNFHDNGLEDRGVNGVTFWQSAVNGEASQMYVLVQALVMLRSLFGTSLSAL
jgi:hypothetical protein